jgi:hypothetical protein
MFSDKLVTVSFQWIGSLQVDQSVSHIHTSQYVALMSQLGCIVGRKQTNFI